MSQSIDLCCVKSSAENLNIVYTPLGGAGYRLVPEVLRRIGITKLHIVPEQAKPDGNFPTTPKPNPEYKQVFECGIPLADKVGSDLIIATDPDADRVGVMARGADGKFYGITGNQMASLLLDYIINAYKTSGKMPPEPYAVKTIVTTELMAKICRAGGVELFNVLTGFKFIGEVIKKKEAEGHGSFIFGAEESYGYLKGTHARDKDSVVASMLICEMTAYYKNHSMTLIDALANLYKQYGYSLEKTDEVMYDGYDAAAKMANLMQKLRLETPEKIAGSKITIISDYLDGSVRYIESGKVSATGLPKSDVIRWQLENSDVIIIRPSGTEPKVKFYYLLSGENEADASAKLAEYKAVISALIKA
jgi:phosphoglucomutase